MKYVSTRGEAPVLGFGDVLLTGLAADGGLYVPERWPALAPERLGARRGPTPTSPPTSCGPTSRASLDRDELAAMVAEAYATFEHPDVCPVVRARRPPPARAVLGADAGLQGRRPADGRPAVRPRADRRGASGPRSSSPPRATPARPPSRRASGRDTLDIVVLHPAGRVSDVQRRQMTTVDAPNVHNVAVEGTFDDCQDLVKALFADVAFRERVRLSAMNSINWARVMAQVVYYVTTAARLGRCSFAVPSGNFGNIFAGWVAERMGLPDRPARHRRRTATTSSPAGWPTARWWPRRSCPRSARRWTSRCRPTTSGCSSSCPAATAPRTAELLHRFRGVGAVEAPQDDRFQAASDRRRRDARRRSARSTTTHRRARRPAHRRRRRRRPVPSAGRADVPMVRVATAHPAKFPDAVEQATGIRPPLPERLADLFEREERFDVLPNDLAAVRAHVLAAIA